MEKPTFVAAITLLSGPVLGCAPEPEGSGDPEGTNVTSTQQMLGEAPDHAWALDEASGTLAKDSGMPGGVNGTLGPSVMHISSGVVGGAVSLPGWDDTSVIDFGPDIGRIGTSDFTASFWIRSTQAEGRELLSNRSCGSACNFFGLRVSPNEVAFEVYQDEFNTNANSVTVKVGTKDGQWHHIVARRSGETLSLFVDETRHDSTLPGIANIVTETPLTFGGNPLLGQWNSYYIGDVDEIKFYRRALDDCEILGSPAQCAPEDQCHEAATCDIKTGVCTSVPKADGTICDDGNACTQEDTCQAGACIAAPIDCAPIDECHEGGLCDPMTGMCSNPAKADGSACTTGTCQAGMCVPKETPNEPTNDSGSCGCRVAGDAGAVPAAFGVAFMGLVFARRRRIARRANHR